MTSFLARTLVESAPKPSKPGTGIDKKRSKKKKPAPTEQPSDAPVGKKRVIPPQDAPEDVPPPPPEQNKKAAEPAKEEPAKESGLDTYDPGQQAADEKKDAAEQEPGTQTDELREVSFKNLPQKVSALDNPQYFMISGRKFPDKLQGFLGENKNILQSKNALLFFKGTKNELEHFYLWFVAGLVLNKLVESAKTAQIPFAYGPLPKSFFSEDTPFNSLKFSKELVDAIGGNQESFRKSLNIQWNKARAQNNENAVDSFPSFQMDSKIDVNYLRFFNQKRREYELYVGGQVPNAGQMGFMYPLVSSQESEAFKKFFQNFVMPAPFYRDMFELSDVDPDFKNVDPTKITPANALIVFALDGTKFEPNTKYAGNKTQLEGLESLAQLLGAPKIKPKLGNTRVIIGSRNVHFSKDFTKAIVWCGHQGKKPPAPADVSKALPFVKGYDDSFV